MDLPAFFIGWQNCSHTKKALTHDTSLCFPLCPWLFLYIYFFDVATGLVILFSDVSSQNLGVTKWLGIKWLNQRLKLKCVLSLWHRYLRNIELLYGFLFPILQRYYATVLIFTHLHLWHEIFPHSCACTTRLIFFLSFS